MESRLPYLVHLFGEIASPCWPGAKAGVIQHPCQSDCKVSLIGDVSQGVFHLAECDGSVAEGNALSFFQWWCTPPLQPEVCVGLETLVSLTCVGEVSFDHRVCNVVVLESGHVIAAFGTVGNEPAGPRRDDDNCAVVGLGGSSSVAPHESFVAGA
jgi:hypothetical protein